jgi:predicted aspartyl protease
MRSISLTVLLPLMIAASPPPVPTPLAGASTDQAHDLRIANDANDRMTVAVRVGASGPYHFLVDTGAERTIISRQLAQRLSLPAGPLTRIQRVAGPSNVATVDIGEIEVATRHFSVAAAPTLETEHIGADGLLGVDSLAASRVLFDFRRGIMGVSPSRAADFPTESGTIVVEARRRHGRLMFTRATVDGAPTVVVIDTGSQVTIGNNALRRRLLGNHALGEPIELLTVAGDNVHAELYRIASLDLDGVELQQLYIAFTDSPVFGQLELGDRPALLLGMNALRGFDKVSIDFATRRVRFLLPGRSMAAEPRLASR